MHSNKVVAQKIIGFVFLVGIHVALIAAAAWVLLNDLPIEFAAFVITLAGFLPFKLVVAWWARHRLRDPEINSCMDCIHSRRSMAFGWDMATCHHPEHARKTESPKWFLGQSVGPVKEPTSCRYNREPYGPCGTHGKDFEQRPRSHSRPVLGLARWMGLI